MLIRLYNVVTMGNVVMDDSILQVKDLKVFYYTDTKIIRAIDGISLNVRKNSAVAIVGESGSGKTTLIHSILKILPSNARIVNGKIIFEGKDLTSLDDEEMKKIRGKKIAAVFQDPLSYLNPVLTIEEQISEVFIYNHGMKKSEAREEVIKLLSMVKIPDPHRVARSYPHQLSGGMAQRVWIAMAIASKPQLLLADEPTSALDPTIQIQILRLLKELKEKIGFSIVIVTHDLSLVAYMVDYVYIMYAGKICEYGEVRSIFKDPKHPYTKALLSSIIDIRNPKREIIHLRGTIPDLSLPPSGCRFHPRCPYATDICREVEPHFRRSGGSIVACHLYI